MTAIVDFEDALHLAQKALQCSICLEVMTNPILTKCGHRFCSHCMSELLQRKKHGPTLCPLCKQAVSKRSLAKQSKFENIVKVMEKLAEAFQEDLIHPTNADWCADTLERDLSQGTLDAECLGNLLDVEHSLTVSSLCGGLAKKAGNGAAAAVAIADRHIGCDSSSRSGGDCADRGAGRQRESFRSQSATSCLVTDGVVGAAAVGASGGCTRPALAGHSDEEQQQQRSLMHPGAATSTDCADDTLEDGMADDGRQRCPGSDRGGWPLERPTVRPSPPHSPLSVSSSADSDSPLIVIDQTAHSGVAGRRCDLPGHAESSVVVVEHQDSARAEDCRATGCATATATSLAPASTAAATGATELLTSSRTVDRSASPRCRSAGPPEIGAADLPGPEPHLHQNCPPVDDRDSDTFSTDVAVHQQEAGFGASADTAVPTAGPHSGSRAAMTLHEDLGADMDIGDDASFDEALIADGQLPSAALTPLVMTGCSLSLQDVEEAQRLARVHLGRYQTAFTSAVTHVLVQAGDAQAYSADELPPKVYLGIASHCHVVKVSWIYDSLQKGRLLPEESYKFGSTLPHEYCIDRSVQLPGPTAAAGRTSGTSGLLATWEVCCSTPCHLLSADDLHDLVRLCGARMIRDPASFSFLPGTCRVILVDKKGAKKETLQACTRLGRLYASPVADYKWLLVCIVHGRPFLPHKRCIDCYVPGCDEQWTRVNVPALFSASVLSE